MGATTHCVALGFLSLCQLECEYDVTEFAERIGIVWPDNCGSTKSQRPDNSMKDKRPISQACAPESFLLVE
eukprot:scaffold137535_cov19-Prasinocladus_malaysianus.AAC.1